MPDTLESKSLLDAFMNSKLAVSLPEDYLLLVEELRECVCDEIQGDRITAEEGKNSVACYTDFEFVNQCAKNAMRKYGPEKACLSFDETGFGWCWKEWYEDRGIQIVPIQELLDGVREEEHKKEDWMELLA